MKFGVVIFPGSNCDADIISALREEMQQEVVALWHKDTALTNFNKSDCIILPGGFSYGDYLRCGAIAKFSPIMQSVVEFAKGGGKVLGICNGFQILCESGLLPGVLLRNANRQFVSKNIFITGEKEEYKQVFKIPVAHGEGRYYANKETLSTLEKNKQIVFRYCDESGNITAGANPNGAFLNIAGICNERGNVIGLMPHPERACSKVLNNEDGSKILSKMFSIN